MKVGLIDRLALVGRTTGGSLPDFDSLERAGGAGIEVLFQTGEKHPGEVFCCRTDMVERFEIVEVPMVVWLRDVFFQSLLEEREIAAHPLFIEPREEPRCPDSPCVTMKPIARRTAGKRVRC